MVRQPKAAPGRDRPFRCNHPKCKWSFPTNSDLKRHKLSHLPKEQRAIVCPVSGCASRFNQTQELKQHMRKHCPKPICELCNEAFSNMFRHKKQRHGYVPKKTDRSHFPEKPPNKSPCGPASSAAAVNHRAASIISTTSAISLGNPMLSSPSPKAGTWNGITLPSTSPLSTSSTYTTPAASPTPSSRYSPQYFKMFPSSLRDVIPLSADYALEPLRPGASCLTSRNVQHHDEKSSPILFSPYSRAWSSRHKKASTPRSLSSSSASMSSIHFTGLTTPSDSPAVSPEVVCPSIMSTSSDPTFRFGYPTDAAWNQEVTCDTYSTGGDVIVAKSQDVLNAHFQCEIPTYDIGAVQPTQQEIFRGYRYPAQQLPTSTAPMGMGYDVCMDPSTRYVEDADTIAASPPQLQVELLTSMTQAAMDYSIYSSLSAEYIDLSTMPLDQPQADPQLELDYSGHGEWPLESDTSFTANFNYALAACSFAREGMVPTMFSGPDGH